MNTTEARFEMEKRIAAKTVEVLIEAGYRISVDDGEEITVSESTNATEILAAMQTTDMDTLRVRREEAGRTVGASVLFVYGNDGYDVIADHSISLSEVLTPAFDLAERFETDGLPQPLFDLSEVAKSATEIVLGPGRILITQSDGSEREVSRFTSLTIQIPGEPYKPNACAVSFTSWTEKAE